MSEAVFDERWAWSVAPMMDRTCRHFRALVHCIDPTIRVYTEMAVAGGDLARLQRTVGRPGAPRQYVAAQLAGRDATSVAAAAVEAQARGFDEVNLNCGCPGPAAQAGGYGAMMMDTPAVVAEIVAAVRAATTLPVSVKCRLSTRPRAAEPETRAQLERFVQAVAAAGCGHVIVHARAAHLSGMSSRDNQRVPPLRPQLVRELASRWPQLRIELNGGIRSVAEGRAATSGSAVAGVMIGRAAYDDPLLWTALSPGVDRAAVLREVVQAMARYVDEQRRDGVAAWATVRHMLGLSRGLPGGKAIRVRLAALSRRPDADGRDVVAAVTAPAVDRAALVPQPAANTTR